MSDQNRKTELLRHINRIGDISHALDKAHLELVGHELRQICVMMANITGCELPLLKEKGIDDERN